MHKYAEDVIDTVLAAIPEYLENGGDSENTQDFKQYAVAVGLVPTTFVWTPDVDAQISEAFFSKVNSQAPLEDEDDDVEEEEEQIYGADDVSPGDLLDMGPYGNPIVYIFSHDDSRFWGTDDIQEYLEKGSDSSGWYFNFYDIEDIVGNAREEDEYDDYEEYDEASIFGRSGITSGSGMPSSRPTTTLSNPLDVRTGKEGAAQKLIGSNEVDFSKLSDEELDDIIGNIGMTESRANICTATIETARDFLIKIS